MFIIAPACAKLLHRFGARDGTTPPHYPWLVAVDPRGGVLMSVSEAPWHAQHTVLCWRQQAAQP